MTQLVTRDRISTKAIGYSLGFALLWGVMAVARPGTTFHLAPFLVALAVPFVYRIQGGTIRSTGIRLVVVGMGLAAVAAAVLAVVGLLQGPSLLPFGGALVESLVAAAAGGVVGIILAAWPYESQ